MSLTARTSELPIQLYPYLYVNVYTAKVQVKTRLASTLQVGVQPVSLLTALEVLIEEATVSVANGYNEVLLRQTCNRQLFLW